MNVRRSMTARNRPKVPWIDGAGPLPYHAGALHRPVRMRPAPGRGGTPSRKRASGSARPSIQGPDDRALPILPYGYQLRIRTSMSVPSRAFWNTERSEPR